MIRPETGETPYQHWVLTVEPPIAALTPAAEVPGADRGDASVELSDALQRIRFEHPEVAAVVITGVAEGELAEMRRAGTDGGAGSRGLRTLVHCGAGGPLLPDLRERAMAAAGYAGRGPESEAVHLGPLWPEEFEGGFAYPNVRVEVDEDTGAATLTVVGPPNHECFAPDPGPRRLRSRWWPLAVCRELDQALSLLQDRPCVRRLVLNTEGDPLAAASADVALTSGYEHDWFVTEVVLYWRRLLLRLDEERRSLVALVEPGSCFVGTLLEMVFAAGRVSLAGGSAEVFLTGMNFGPLPMASGLTRLESRFADRRAALASLAQRVGDPICADQAVALGLFSGQAPGVSGTSR